MQSDLVDEAGAGSEDAGWLVWNTWYGLLAWLAVLAPIWAVWLVV